MSKFLQGVINASCEIIPILRSRESRLFTRHGKGAGGDVSMGADLLCEEIFCAHLLEMADVDSEESGLIKSKARENLKGGKSKNSKKSKKQKFARDCIVLDPLDGSDNYLSGVPYFGASLALCDAKGAIKEAAVVNFCTAEVFYDSHTQNKPQKIDIFSGAEIALQGGEAKCGVFEKAYSNPKIAKKLYKHNIKFRSLGASALSLAYALENNFMLFGGSIRRYDAKAGLFLCRNLEIIHKKDFLLVSQNKEVFGIISRILL